MKTSLKPLAIILALSMIFNGCSVYYKKEVSFNEAAQSKKPLRLITNENKKVFLKKITLKDSIYYGTYKYNGEEVTFPLSKEAYKSLRIKNRTASTIVNVIGFGIPLGVVVLIITYGSGSWTWKTTNQNSIY